MPYGLKKLLEIEAERKKRREEKARLKAEKEKKKLEEKKAVRRRRKLRKKWARQNAKRKQALQEYRKLTGDENGIYRIYLMKNGKMQKYLGFKRYKNEALKKFYDLVDTNNASVKFKQDTIKMKNRLYHIKYELILVKKLDDNDCDPISLLRNDEGKFVENYLVDTPNYKIIEKKEWFIEEKFGVYGYDLIRDRKDFDFIMENLVLKPHDNYMRVMVHLNRVIFHYDTDFDFVVCKSVCQAEHLYNAIEDAIDHKKNPLILFMGKLSQRMSGWMTEETIKKTGWSKYQCEHAKKGW